MSDNVILLTPDELDQIVGGVVTEAKQTSSGQNLACPRCQCPEFTWTGRKYTCTECGYQGYV